MPRGTDRYDEARLQGRLWTPLLMGRDFFAGYRTLNESGVAGSDVVRNSSDEVSQWSDWSGKGHHATNDGLTGVKLVYSATGLSSAVPGLLGGTGISWLRCGSITLIPNGTLIQLLAVAKLSDSVWGDGSNTIVSFAGDTFHDEVAGYGYKPLCQEGAGSLTLAARPGTASVKSYTANTPMVIASTLDGTNNIVYVNGAAGTTVAYAAPSSNSAGIVELGIGNYADRDSLAPNIGKTLYNSSVSEIVIITGALSAQARQRVEGYLAHKHLLASSLSASHPFRNRPPLIGD